MSAALFPGFAPAPRHDPLHDAAVAMQNARHPDADEASAALDAIAAAAGKLRLLARGASSLAIRRTAESARGALLDVATDFATDIKAEAEDYERDGWRRYCDEADRAYEARRAREDACGEVSPRAEAGR
jgi:hypothetical protein